VDVENQNITVSVTFEVYCNSTGYYTCKNATEYCLEVTECQIKHSGSLWSEAVKVDQELFGGVFCFVQTESGKIPIVRHDANESQQVVDFKKGLISGFQTNFKGTDMEEEFDPDSVHLSHYNYTGNPSEHMVRHFHQYNIARFADTPDLPINYSKREDIEYNGRVLSHARGQTDILVPQRPYEGSAHVQTHMHHTKAVQESILNKANRRHSRSRRHRREMRRTQQQNLDPEGQSFFPTVKISDFSVHSTYTLDLVRCGPPGSSRTRRDTRSRTRRENAAQTSIFGHKGVNLNNVNVTSLLESIHRNPDQKQQVEVLKKYLSTEDKLDSAAPAITETVGYFNNIRQSSQPKDVAMRLKLYPVLAPLTNTEAQQALLSHLESVTYATEWNTLVMNIALLASPSSELVTGMQALIEAEAVRDPNSLLLAYGALASRASPNLQNEMVAFLRDHLQKCTANMRGDLIPAINALGNSGSHQIVDVLLGFVGDDTIDIQLAAINALRKQARNTYVVAAFLEQLRSDSPISSIVAAIANILVRDIEEPGVNNVETSLSFAGALVSASEKLNNSYVSQLVSRYLHLLQQSGVEMGRRLRREAGNWVEAGSEYNVIALHEARQNDQETYPKHSAHLWSRQIGVQNFNMQVVAGMFTGASDTGEEHKILGRTVTKVNAFGISARAVEIEAVRTQHSGGIHKVVYVTVGGYVLLESEAFADGKELPKSFGGGTEYLVTEVEFVSYVDVATITTRIAVYAHLDNTFEVNAVNMSKERSFSTRGSISPSLVVSVHGSSTVNILHAEGGTDIDGSIGYAFEAEGDVSGCKHGPPAFSVATTIQDQWPSGYIRLSSWYRPQKPPAARCGSKPCLDEGDILQDSEPLEPWKMGARSSQELWADTVSTGPVQSDWEQCPPPTESEFQAWYDYPDWPSDVGPAEDQ
jgi:hypothetical protein